MEGRDGEVPQAKSAGKTGRGRGLWRNPCPVKQKEPGVVTTRCVVRNKAGELNGAHPQRFI